MNINFNLADLIKAPLKIFIGIMIASGIVLFSPEIVISKLYMLDFRKQYGFAIAIVFLISFSVSMIGMVTTFWSWYREKSLTRKAIKNAKACLKGMDDYKAAIIYELYTLDNHTDVLPINDGAVRWLEQLLIIGKATNQYPIMDMQNPVFPYMLQPWVVSELNSNKELKEKYQSSYKRVVRKYN